MDISTAGADCVAAEGLTKMRVAPFSQKYLRDILDYDQYTGLFRWRIMKRGNAMKGMVAAAGSRVRSYQQIGIDKKMYSAHHLAWYYIYGEWPNFPEEEIDHINCDKRDNRILNLRKSTRTLNRGNMKKYKNNTTGVKGIRVRPSGRFEAQIQFNGKKMTLGTFDTKEQASLAYAKAAQKYFGEFARRA